MVALTHQLWFPDPDQANDDGFLAFGGDLSPQRLLLAYQSGIFPWYEAGQPILWYSPNPRMILKPDQFKVSKSFKKTLQKHPFTITFNTAFEAIIKACATTKRKGQRGTWITPEMQQAYNKLHKLGWATSIEIWKNEQLVGGLYGIDLKQKKIFCGESMFSIVSEASKIALYALSKYCEQRSYYFIDCQMYTTHLESLGATCVKRSIFLSYLRV